MGRRHAVILGFGSVLDLGATRYRGGLESDFSATTDLLLTSAVLQSEDIARRMEQQRFEKLLAEDPHVRHIRRQLASAYKLIPASVGVVIALMVFIAIIANWPDHNAVTASPSGTGAAAAAGVFVGLGSLLGAIRRALGAVGRALMSPFRVLVLRRRLAKAIARLSDRPTDSDPRRD